MIDSHAHLTSDDLYPEIETLLQRAKSKGLKKIVNICTDLKTLERGLALSQKHPWIVNAGATTPHDVEKEGGLYFHHFQKACEQKKLIAVGETGLDYFYTHSPKELQKEYFCKYMALSKEFNLPLIIHCRDAFDDFFQLIDEHYPLEKKGVLHCFTGDKDHAVELVKRGWYVSFSGIITFKKSDALREALKRVPFENLLIETDSPYLAPQSKRGKINEPSFINETAQKIAEVKKVPLAKVIDFSTKNALDLFKLHE